MNISARYLLFISPGFFWCSSITVFPDTLFIVLETDSMSMEQVALTNTNNFPVNINVSILEQSSGGSYTGSGRYYPLETGVLFRDRQPDIKYMNDAGQWVPGIRCGTLESPDDVLAQVRADLESSNFERDNDRDQVRIQVAWHVIHSDSAGAGNLTNAMIMDQIDVWNNAYAPYDIFFTLDIVDYTENNAWFNDIEQYEDTYKQLLHVDPVHFLNIYSGNTTGGFLGWSYLPYQWPESNYMHGVCLLYSTLPGGSSFPYNQGDTGTHEVGHYLGLDHTFLNGCSEDNDSVDDTPQENDDNNIYSCNNTDTCPDDPGMDPVHNFMTYTDDACLNEFTDGQGIRMNNMIATYRPGLLENPVSPEWITANENAFQVPANDVYDLSFTIDATGMLGGDNYALVYFEAAEMDTTVLMPIVLHIAGITGLDLSFESVHDSLYPDESSDFFLEMNYNGTNELTYEFTDDLSWLTVLNGEGTLENGESQLITFNINSSLMSPGTYMGAVLLTTNMGYVSLQVTLEVLDTMNMANGNMPYEFSVSNNYPNPFNLVTNFSISLREKTMVTAMVVDLRGREVATIINSTVNSGVYHLTWLGRNMRNEQVGSGIYLLRVAAGEHHHQQKMIFIK